MKKHKKRIFYVVSSFILIILLLPLSPVVLTKEYRCNGEQTNLVVLTFDDGDSSWVNTIMPILMRYSIPATGYINDPGDIPDFTWDDVRLLHDNGWEIGWHTAHHDNVIKLDRTALANDYDTCKSLFQDNGIPVPVSFAYPYGIHDHRSVAVIAEYFETARTIHAGVNTPVSVDRDPYLLSAYKITRGVPFFEKVINEKAGNSSLIIIAGHTIGDAGQVSSEKPDLGVEEFERLVMFLSENEMAGKIDMVTLREGYLSIKEREYDSYWSLTFDSPFSSWDKSFGIPLPSRYTELYDYVFQRKLRHYFPFIVPSFTPYLIILLVTGTIGLMIAWSVAIVVSRCKERKTDRNIKKV